MSNLTIYWGLSSKKEKLKKKKFELKSGKKIIIKLLQVGQWLDLFNKAHCPIQHNFQLLFLFFITILFFLSRHILLLIFNYFFLFILNHTRLLSSWFLHFILLNFITSSFTLFIYVSPSSLFVTSVSSTSTGAAVSLLKFLVSNFINTIFAF